MEQRAQLRLSQWDMPGALADLVNLAEEAERAATFDRRTVALLEMVFPLVTMDHHRGLSAIEEARIAQSDSHNPALGAVVDIYRAFFDIYLHGWNRPMADMPQAALHRLNLLSDVRIRNRVAWMEGTTLAYAGEYSVACLKADASRQNSRKAGMLFDYFS